MVHISMFTTVFSIGFEPIHPVETVLQTATALQLRRLNLFYYNAFWWNRTTDAQGFNLPLYSWAKKAYSIKVYGGTWTLIY